jgi:carboxylate-amine ligase
LLEEYLEFVDPVLDELGSRRDVEHVRWIMEHGSGADRQLAEFARTSDLSEVVEFMVRETQAGL